MPGPRFVDDYIVLADQTDAAAEAAAPPAVAGPAEEADQTRLADQTDADVPEADSDEHTPPFLQDRGVDIFHMPLGPDGGIMRAGGFVIQSEYKFKYTMYPHEGDPKEFPLYLRGHRMYNNRCVFGSRGKLTPEHGFWQISYSQVEISGRFFFDYPRKRTTKWFRALYRGQLCWTGEDEDNRFIRLELQCERFFIRGEFRWVEHEFVDYMSRLTL